MQFLRLRRLPLLLLLAGHGYVTNVRDSSWRVCGFSNTHVITGLRYKNEAASVLPASFGKTPNTATPLTTTTRRRLSKNDNNNDATTTDPDDDDAMNEARRLLARAREIRDDVAIAEKERPPSPTPTQSTSATTAASLQKTKLPFTLDDDEAAAVGYRLYVDIGRESGTWMEPRWGASGTRIPFTLDVSFREDELAGDDVIQRMVKDNFGGKSSVVRVVKAAPYARLRGGFDRMACHGGGYRFDVERTKTTVRFYVLVDGTPVTDSSYGDVSVPEGCLYFSVPCFGVGVGNLSTKEYPVTVRMVGWNTGWCRMESRMAGVFRAVAIDQARKKDGF